MTQFAPQAPEVSALVVSFNAGAALGSALRSLLDQSLRSLEVVLVDNASSDGSVDAVRRQLQDPRLRVVHLDTNRGAYGGAVVGLMECRAPVIARLDADDLAHPLRLDTQLRQLRQDPTLDAVSCSAYLIDDHDRCVGTIDASRSPEQVRAMAPLRMPIVHPGLCVRRALLAQVPYRPAFDSAGDMDWVARASEQHRIAVTAERLVGYRQRTTTISAARQAFQHAHACVVRITSQRRRAGLPEDLDAELARAREVVAEHKSAQGVLAHYGRWFFEQGLHAQALVCWDDALEIALTHADRRVARSVAARLLKSDRHLGLVRLSLLGATLLPLRVQRRLLALRRYARRARGMLLELQGQTLPLKNPDVADPGSDPSGRAGSG